MKFDWQAVAVAFIIAGALFYVARRALARLRSFRPGKGGGSCETGCGTCGDVDAPIRQSAPPPVKIGRPGGTGRPRR